MLELKSLIKECDEDQKGTISVYFRMLTKGNLNVCGECECSGFLKEYGITLNGTDASITRCTLMDCICLLLAEIDRDYSLIYTTEGGLDLAKKKGFKGTRGSLEESLGLLESVVGGTGSTEEKDDDEEDFPDRGENDEDDIPTGELEPEPVPVQEPVVKVEEPKVEEPKAEEPKAEEPVIKTPEEPTAKEPDEPKKEDKEYSDKDLNSIDSYYSGSIINSIDLLVKCYTDMFQSGYELTSFAGVVTDEGIARLSGQSIDYSPTRQRDNMSRLLKRKMNVETGSNSFVCRERSNNSIANRVYDSYSRNRDSKSFPPLYFPYKMLEFAYGRMAPTGDNQDGLTDYPKHANSANWVAYCNTEVKQSLSRLLKSCVRKFVISCSDKDNWFSESIGNGVEDFLRYLVNCLSICILVVDWTETLSDIGTGNETDSFKIRLCDPYDYVKGDITPEILQSVFMNNVGVDSYSSEPVYPNNGISHVKEFSHEFNHRKAQSMPLFAYKAAQALEEQGIHVNMDNLVLGRATNGRILRNKDGSGTNSVSVSDNVTHFIIAGSRSGKGVMTLNILAAGIASGRSIFYLDRKPDMASLFQSLCPEMFIINGGDFDEKSDRTGYFTNLMRSLRGSEKLDKFFPDYVRSPFGNDFSMSTVFDMAYIRGLKLILSIIMALYTSQNTQKNSRLGGDNGIMLVVDEISNLYSKGFNEIFSKYVDSIPPISLAKDFETLTSGKLKSEADVNTLKSKIERNHSHGGYYALMYLGNIAKDIMYMSSKVNAGSDPTYIEKIDIFAIGQNLNPEPGNVQALRGLTLQKQYRYKTADNKGRTNESNKVFGTTSKDGGNNYIYNMLAFQESRTDAFIGYNKDNLTYMGCDKEDSPAVGKLDQYARNFAYLKNFARSTRDKLVGYGSRDLAKEAVYFKPFLILNNNERYYTDQTITFLKDVIDVDVLKAENSQPNPNPNTGFSDGVGFPGYLKMILPEGTDFRSTLSKSGEIANYVVQEILGYDGDWFDFCLDHRAEWAFNISDITAAIIGEEPKDTLGFFNRSVDSTFEEYIMYMKLSGQARQEEESGEASAKLLDGSYAEVDGVKSSSERAMRQLFASSMPKVEPEEDPDDYPEDGQDDFPDDFQDDPIDLDEDDYDEDDEEDEDDLEDDPEVDPYKTEWERERAKKEIKDDIVEGRQHRGVPNEEPKVSRDNMSAAEKIAEGICSQDELSEIISRLQNLGFTIQYNGNPTTEQPVFSVPERNPRYSEPTVYKDDDEDDIKYRKRRTHNRFFSNNRVESRAGRKLDDRFNFSDGESIESFENLVRYITKDVLATFGGRDRVKSFKCKGGSIIINGYVYKCHVGSEMARSLPYDIRARLGASCVASLYDYKSLIGMRGLSKLSFDDINFVYDYVSTTMGYGSRVSVDLFFNDIPSLRELRIGKKVFTRDNYKQRLKGEDRDMFYQPKLLKRTADFTDSFIENRFKDSWALTVDSARNRKYGALRRVGGVVVGSTLTATTGVTSAGVKVVRKGFQSIHRIANSFKDVFKEYDDIRNEDE